MKLWPILPFLLGCGGEAFTAAEGDAGSSDAGSDAIGLPRDASPTYDAQACPAGQCLPAAPSGWLGPFAVAIGATVPTACDTGYEGGKSTSGSGLHAGPAACGCTCGVPSGTQCSATVNFQGTTCTNGSTATVSSGTCMTGAPLQGQSNLVIKADTTAQGGSCLVTPSVSKPTVSWDERALSCAPFTMPTSMGCGGSDLCLPSLRTPFRACVRHDGAGSCPVGPYTEKHLEYGGITDGRACTTCTCGNPTSVTCGGSIDVFGTQGCTGGAGYTTNNFGQCVTVTSIYNVAYKYNASSSGGSCAASSVTATGDVQPATPITFCCLP